jgi:hypothetical protein
MPAKYYWNEVFGRREHCESKAQSSPTGVVPAQAGIV